LTNGAGIAAALAGEINAYVDLLSAKIDGRDAAASYRLAAGLNQDARLVWLRTIPPLPSAHPVFDKVAEKIGQLPHAEAYAISRFYNVITGMRLRRTAAECNLNPQGGIAQLLE
jgi:hypothetical protein